MVLVLAQLGARRLAGARLARRRRRVPRAAQNERVPRAARRARRGLRGVRLRLGAHASDLLPGVRHLPVHIQAGRLPAARSTRSTGF